MATISDFFFMPPDLFVSGANLRRARPLHPPHDNERLAWLAESMRASGWSGRPLLAVRREAGVQGLTGSHRLAAAQTVAAGGDDIQVPVVEVDMELVGLWAIDSSQSGEAFIDRLVKCDDVTRIALLEDSGDRKAWSLMEAEAAHNLVEGDDLGRFLRDVTPEQVRAIAEEVDPRISHTRCRPAGGFVDERLEVRESDREVFARVSLSRPEKALGVCRVKGVMCAQRQIDDGTFRNLLDVVTMAFGWDAVAWPEEVRDHVRPALDAYVANGEWDSFPVPHWVDPLALEDADGLRDGWDDDADDPETPSP